MSDSIMVAQEMIDAIRENTVVTRAFHEMLKLVHAQNQTLIGQNQELLDAMDEEEDEDEEHDIDCDDDECDGECLDEPPKRRRKR